ncbi:hypothetical protein BH23PAT2_BH23PAT2_02330 [soil metagenome]
MGLFKHIRKAPVLGAETGGEMLRAVDPAEHILIVTEPPIETFLRQSESELREFAEAHAEAASVFSSFQSEEFETAAQNIFLPGLVEIHDEESAEGIRTAIKNGSFEPTRPYRRLLRSTFPGVHRRLVEYSWVAAQTGINHPPKIIEDKQAPAGLIEYASYVYGAISSESGPRLERLQLAERQALGKVREFLIDNPDHYDQLTTWLLEQFDQEEGADKHYLVKLLANDVWSHEDNSVLAEALQKHRGAIQANLLGAFVTRLYTEPEQSEGYDDVDETIVRQWIGLFGEVISENGMQEVLSKNIELWPESLAELYERFETKNLEGRLQSVIDGLKEAYPKDALIPPDQNDLVTAGTALSRAFKKLITTQQGLSPIKLKPRPPKRRQGDTERAESPEVPNQPKLPIVAITYDSESGQHIITEAQGLIDMQIEAYAGNYKGDDTLAEDIRTMLNIITTPQDVANEQGLRKGIKKLTDQTVTLNDQPYGVWRFSPRDSGGIGFSSRDADQTRITFIHLKQDGQRRIGVIGILDHESFDRKYVKT